MGIIDSSDLVLGRMATVIATRLLKGERVTIINAENTVISGNRKQIIERYSTKRSLQAKGNPEKGPKFSRMPDRMVRIAVRGMLPYKRKRGKEAFKNLKVYIGTPKEIDVKTAGKIEEAKNKLMEGFITVGEISKALGARW